MVPEQIFVDSKITQHWDTLQCSLLPLMLHFLSPSAVPIGQPVGHEIHSNDSNKEKKMKRFFSRPSYFQPSGFPHGQGRGGTALLLSWEWMAGSGQKLIKLALAKGMNCGTVPWIASNPISLAQLVMRSWDEFQPARKHSSWTFPRKSIHWTLTFLLKFYWIFTQGSTFPTGLFASIFPFEFLSLNNSVNLKWATSKKQSKPPQLEFNIIRRSWYKR